MLKVLATSDTGVALWRLKDGHCVVAAEVRHHKFAAPAMPHIDLCHTEIYVEGQIWMEVCTYACGDAVKCTAPVCGRQPLCWRLIILAPKAQHNTVLLHEPVEVWKTQRCTIRRRTELTHLIAVSGDTHLRVLPSEDALIVCRLQPGEAAAREA